MAHHKRPTRVRSVRPVWYGRYEADPGRVYTAEEFLREHAAVVGRKRTIVVSVDAGSRKSVREFLRFCDAVAVVPTAVEFRAFVVTSGRTQTGPGGRPLLDPDGNRMLEPMRDEHGRPVTETRAVGYECVGGEAALDRVKGHPLVTGWSFPMSTRPPVNAVGSGPEKSRPATGSAFGKPETAQATAEQLAADRSRRLTAERAGDRI